MGKQSEGFGKCNTYLRGVETLNQHARMEALV